MKLHLGCGMRYLNGYVNIDFPAPEHTILKNNTADKHADILELNYAEESIEEVRLHHVFEHFTRPVACALLASWYSWLRPGGILDIEVPDLYRTGAVIFNPFKSYRKKNVAIRHLFGSHEAPWAIHCEGYTPKTLSLFLKKYGFKKKLVKKNRHKGTYNFEIIAQKDGSGKTKKDFERATREYLRNFLVDSNKEKELLSVWIDIYNKQIEKTWGGKIKK